MSLQIENRQQGDALGGQLGAKNQGDHAEQQARQIIQDAELEARRLLILRGELHQFFAIGVVPPLQRCDLLRDRCDLSIDPLLHRL